DLQHPIEQERDMKRLALPVAAAVLASGVVAALVPTSASAQTACSFPTAMAPTPEQTAWQLFVAASCAGINGNQLAWEDWVEQLALYPACATCNEIADIRRVPKRLHGSPLAIILGRGAPNRAGAPALAPNSECGTMGAPPPNVVANATICEEARLNPEAAAF